LSVGNLKVGLSHRLNDKNVLGTSISKNFAKGSPVTAEIGV